jgi:NAD(P)-dependent dehydrogenase (short-subunit alcohol dehydrogenase family)
MADPKTWLITGTSTGFGRALAEEVLARGDRVVGTLRKADQAAAFEALAPGRARACLLDLTDRDRVRPAIAEAIAAAAGVDVVVNNAGYGLAGAAEEVSDGELRHQMETNFLGLVAVTQAALPVLRRQGHGHIVNIASLAGLMGIGGFPLYCASKFAVVGFSESLAQEVAPLGLKVTVVEPGTFRTNWSSDTAITRAEKVIDAYAETAGALRDRLGRLHGQQPGDPVKAAQAILRVVDAPDPPLHLPLGRDALAAVRHKLATLTAEVEAWAAVGEATAFDD